MRKIHGYERLRVPQIGKIVIASINGIHPPHIDGPAMPPMPILPNAIIRNSLDVGLRMKRCK